MGRKQVSKRNRASRGCTGKVRYADEHKAVEAAFRRGMRHYRCGKCRGWHLTTAL